MNIFEILLVNPLINVLVAVFRGLSALNAPGALGFSIILSTAIIRLILYPFTAAQLKFSQKMQEIQPHLKKIKEKHKDNPVRMQQEQVALFKQHGTNPAAGCIPFIVQIVLLLGFYNAILKVIDLKPKETISIINNIVYFDFLKLNQAWDTSFFGISLAQTPAGLLSEIGYLIVIVPVITGALQFIQAKMMAPAKTAPAARKATADVSKQADFAQAMQSQMLYMMPLIIGIASYQFALGLSLYWNTFTIFGIIQQYRIQGLGGLSHWINKEKWMK